VVAPGASVRLTPSRIGAPRRRSAKRTSVSDDRADAGSGASSPRRAHLTAAGRSSTSRIRSGAGQAVGAGVVLRAELAQRRVELGSEDEHGQPASSASARRRAARRP
jgi:hypothetical protein